MNIIQVWGPKLWYFFHIIAYMYPNNPSPDTIKKYYELYSILIPRIIPCNYCKEHYINNLDLYKLKQSLSNKKKYIQWTIDIHNEVNLRKGKKIYTFNECNKIYNKINHKVLFELLRYYYNTSSYNNDKYIRFIYFLEIFITYFPCNTCRCKLYNLFKIYKNPYLLDLCIKDILNSRCVSCL